MATQTIRADHRPWRAMGISVAILSVAAASLFAAGAAGATPAGGISPDRGPAKGGTTVTFTMPSPVTSIDAGEAHALALGADGRAYSWGRNDKGQLGHGTTGSTGAPAKVQRGEADSVRFTAIAAGSDHSL